MWLHSLMVAQLLRSAACLHTNQSQSYLNHLVFKTLRPSVPTSAVITDFKNIYCYSQHRLINLHITTFRHRLSTITLMIMVFYDSVTFPIYRMFSAQNCVCPRYRRLFDDYLTKQEITDDCGSCTKLPRTVMRRLTTGIRSEKCVVRRFRRCANLLVCTYTDLDSTV